jgi:hypothetical protein
MKLHDLPEDIIYHLTNFTDTILPLSRVNNEFNSIYQEKVKKGRIATRELYRTKSNRTFCIYGVKNVDDEDISSQFLSHVKYVISPMFRLHAYEVPVCYKAAKIWKKYFISVNKWTRKQSL